MCSRKGSQYELIYEGMRCWLHMLGSPHYAAERHLRVPLRCPMHGLTRRP